MDALSQAFLPYALLSFAIGSVPFGILLAKLFRLPDPRTIGSGNIGATNMLRTGNKKVALLTLLLDAGKGVAAVWLARNFFPHPGEAAVSAKMEAAGCFDHAAWSLEAQAYCDQLAAQGFPMAVAAIALLLAALGHMYSPWLKWKGGKGVATILGGTLALSWPVGITFCCIWLLLFLFTRFVSLASIVALAAIPLAAWLRLDGRSAAILALACGVAIYKHRSNMARLLRGDEPKMGGKA